MLNSKSEFTCVALTMQYFYPMPRSLAGPVEWPAVPSYAYTPGAGHVSSQWNPVRPLPHNNYMHGAGSMMWGYHPPQLTSVANFATPRRGDGIGR